MDKTAKFTEVFPFPREELARIIREEYRCILSENRYFDSKLGSATLDDLSDDQILDYVNSNCPINEHMNKLMKTKTINEFMTGLVVTAFKDRMISLMTFPKEYWDAYFGAVNDVMKDGLPGFTFTKTDHMKFVNDFNGYLKETKSDIEIEKLKAKNPAGSPATREERLAKFTADMSKKTVDTDEKMLKKHLELSLEYYVKNSENLHPLIVFVMSRLYTLLRWVVEKKVDIKSAVMTENRVLRVLMMGLNAPITNKTEMANFDKVAEDNFKKMLMAGETVIVPRDGDMNKQDADKLFMEHIKQKDL